MDWIGRRKRARGVTGRGKERGVTLKKVTKSEGAVGVRSLVETAKRTVKVGEGIGRKRGIGAAETRKEKERGLGLGEDRGIERAIVRGVAKREIGAIGRKAERERGRRIERGEAKRERGVIGRIERGEAAVDRGGKRRNAK